jgi:hypothetical protein
MKLEAWDIEDAAREGDVARILQIFSRHFPRQDFGAAEGWGISYWPDSYWFRVRVCLGPPHDTVVFTCLDGSLFLRLAGGAHASGVPAKSIVVEGRVPYRRVP